MDNSKKLTPEEIAILAAKNYPESYYSEPFTPHNWVIIAMKQYAAQEVAEKNTEIESLKSEYAEYTIRSINDQAKLKQVILEKDALLKFEEK